MAKKTKVSKRLSAKKIEADVDRIMKGMPVVEGDLYDTPTVTTKPTSGIVVVRDYVTYSAYEDPIEG